MGMHILCFQSKWHFSRYQTPQSHSSETDWSKQKFGNNHDVIFMFKVQWIDIDIP